MSKVEGEVPSGELSDDKTIQAKAQSEPFLARRSAGKGKGRLTGR
jgi:hypothetical protein